MISAVGTKKKTAASTHRLREDVPLWAAAAIHRGPSTAAMLNNNTSQKPISRRSCDLASVCKSVKLGCLHPVQCETKTRPAFAEPGFQAYQIYSRRILSAKQIDTPCTNSQQPHQQQRQRRSGLRQILIRTRAG